MGTSGCGDSIAISRPSAGEAGRTGEWRSKRPVVTAEKCLAAKAGKVTCQICWAHCPEASISKGAGPVIDLTYCKGCGICAEVCPADAIEMRDEAEHGVCAAAEEE